MSVFKSADEQFLKKMEQQLREEIDSKLPMSLEETYQMDMNLLHGCGISPRDIPRVENILQMMKIRSCTDWKEYEFYKSLLQQLKNQMSLNYFPAIRDEKDFIVKNSIISHLVWTNNKGNKIISHSKGTSSFLCQFHSEKTPSLYVRPDSNIFNCFACGRSGNSIDYISMYEKMSKEEAKALIAKLYLLNCPDVENFQNIELLERYKETLFSEAYLEYLKKIEDKFYAGEDKFSLGEKRLILMTFKRINETLERVKARTYKDYETAPMSNKKLLYKYMK